MERVLSYLLIDDETFSAAQFAAGEVTRAIGDWPPAYCTGEAGEVKDPSLELLFLANDENSADCTVCVNTIEASPTEDACSDDSGSLVKQ
jgi:hypothetical protein